MKPIPYEQQDFLTHYGTIGMKWGIRRYQNKDGSLTEAGRKRYLTGSGRLNERGERELIDNLDGTYFDTRKAQRILGPLGKPIDFYRAANHDIKATEKREAEREKKLYEEEPHKKKEIDIDSAKIDGETFSKQMARSGWSSKTSDYGTGRIVESTSRCKFGSKEVDIKALYDTNTALIGPEELCFMASKIRDKYVNEYKKVLSTTTETNARDLYDSGYFMKYNGNDSKYNSWTRQDFKKNMANMIQSIELDTEFAETMTDVARSLVTFRGEGEYKDLFFGDAPTIVYDIYGDKTLFLTELNT